jgi:hypothetical protein
MDCGVGSARSESCAGHETSTLDKVEGPTRNVPEKVVAARKHCKGGILMGIRRSASTRLRNAGHIAAYCEAYADVASVFIGSLIRGVGQDGSL